MTEHRSEAEERRSRRQRRVRYGARSEEELRNRELEATSVGAWATTLTAIYETDPDVIAAVLPPPLEPPDQPLARITIATVDIKGLPTFGAATVAVEADVILRESRFDPVADIPVGRIVEVTLAERRSVQRGEIVTHVPGEWLRPYVHQRYDDLSPVGED